MSKNKKNSNYATEKRASARQEAERKKRRHEIKMRIVAFAIPILVITGIVLAIVFTGRALGWWDEQPQSTAHAAIEIEGYGSLHVELYGNHAPESVAAFVRLIEDKAYDGIRIDKIRDGIIETASINSKEKIPGEYAEAGFDSIVKHKAGTLTMVRGEDAKADGEFMILTEENKDMDGKYAAFGRITDGMDVLEKLMADVERGEDGSIEYADRPVITSITTHAHHH